MWRKTYGLLTKCEVKMAGYWPSSFFCVFMDRDEVEVHKRAKKRTKPISSHLDRTNLVNKGSIIWLLTKFCSRAAAGSPEWARWLHLARSGSQSQRAHWVHLARSRSLPYNKYRLLTKCEYKMAGFWPSSSFANIQPSWPNKLGQ